MIQMLKNIFFNMFSDPPFLHAKCLLIRKITREKGVPRNCLKYSDFRYANYKFVDSFLYY